MSLLGVHRNDNNKFENYLIESETIESIYKLILDEICFTNKRIIFIDREVLSTKKCIVSLPYKSIHYFSIETRSIFDLNNELILYTKGVNFKIEFAKGVNIFDVQKLLTQYVC